MFNLINIIETLEFLHMRVTTVISAAVSGHFGQIKLKSHLTSLKWHLMFNGVIFSLKYI